MDSGDESKSINVGYSEQKCTIPPCEERTIQFKQVFIQENILQDIKQEDATSEIKLHRTSCKIQEKKFLQSYESGVNIYGKEQTLTSLSIVSCASSTNTAHKNDGSLTAVVRTVHFTCAVCLQLLPTWHLLIQHVFSHNKCLNAPSYVCEQCGDMFPNLLTLLKHSPHNNEQHKYNHGVFVKDTTISHTRIDEETYCNTHLSEQQFPLVNLLRNETEEEPITAAICCSLKNQDKILALEFSANPYVHSDTFTPSFSSRPQQRNRSSKQLFVCNICGLVCSHSGSLKTHQIIHSGVRAFVCEICGMKFTQAGNLKRHNRTHTGERPFVCENCGKSFMDSIALKRHRTIHTGEKPFACKACGKCFSEYNSLKRHRRIHTGERPFICSVCGKSFTDSRNLKMHQNIHTGEQPFICEICGKSCTESGSLKKHKRIHTGERPFTCEVCEKSFTESGYLKKHKRIHAGERPFSCDVCGNAFTDSGSLKVHKRTHTGERPFTCEVCGKRFTQSSNLKKHKIIHESVISSAL